MNRYVRPIMFAFEPDVVDVFMLAQFGASGAPTLNTNYSKGICNLSRSTVLFTGDTTSGSASLANVSSFYQLFKGMTVSGVGVVAGQTISSFNATGSALTFSASASASNTGVSLAALGGQFTVTFGSQYSPARFDPYVRLLNFGHSWDQSAVSGNASGLAGTPAAPSLFLVKNNISNSSLANLVFQFGSYSGATFTASDPASGDILRMNFRFTRSTAV